MHANSHCPNHFYSQRGRKKIIANRTWKWTIITWDNHKQKNWFLNKQLMSWASNPTPTVLKCVPGSSPRKEVNWNQQAQSVGEVPATRPNDPNLIPRTCGKRTELPQNSLTSTLAPWLVCLCMHTCRCSHALNKQTNNLFGRNDLWVHCSATVVQGNSSRKEVKVLGNGFTLSPY